MDKQELIRYIEEKDYKKAKELILSEEHSVLDDVEIQKYLGLCNINLGCFKEAAENFEYLQSKDVEDTLSMYYLSTIYISQNKLKESEELLLKLISLREEYLDAYKTLAVCLLRQ